VLRLNVLAVGTVLVRRQKLKEELSSHLAAELLPRLDIVQQNLHCCLVYGRLPQRHGGTFIHEAAAKGDDKVLEIVFQLEGLGGEAVDLEVKDDLGKTPLFRAIEQGHATCVRLLMKHGADPNTQSKLLRAPFMLLHGDERLCTVDEAANKISLQPKAKMPQRITGLFGRDLGLAPISVPGALYGVPGVIIEAISRLCIWPFL
jgi:hypothetical protein